MPIGASIRAGLTTLLNSVLLKALFICKLAILALIFINQVAYAGNLVKELGTYSPHQKPDFVPRDPEASIANEWSVYPDMSSKRLQDYVLDQRLPSNSKSSEDFYGLFCLLAGRDIGIDATQVSICNASSATLNLVIQEATNQGMRLVSLKGGEVQFFPVRGDGTLQAVVPTGNFEKTFLLTAGKKYTLEAQENEWVIAQPK